MSLAPFFHRSSGHSALGRMIDDYENYLSHKGLGPPLHTYIPNFDVRETRDEYQLEGELPGVKQKDISLEFSDSNTLNIAGHTEHSSEEKDGSWWVSERSMGNFRRSFSFPSSIDQNATTAHLRDGVLGVNIPKTAKKTDTKKIEVEE